jgi:hypothetical protein
MLTVVIAALLALGVAATVPATADTRAGASGTNATYHNNATMAAADPYVLYDKASGYYYAHSTDGADRGWHFASTARPTSPRGRNCRATHSRRTTRTTTTST